MSDVLEIDRIETLINALRSGLRIAGYCVKFTKSINVRVVGVHEGELILAVTCSVFKVDGK
jgi:hypothetical protein